MKKITLLLSLLLTLFANAQLIQGSIRAGSSPNQVEIWIRPDFSNNTQYLFQLGFPVSWPSVSTNQPTSITAVQDTSFLRIFGTNYIQTINQVAHNTVNTENYFNIVLVRIGSSDPQIWTAGREYKVLTVTFNPGTAPNSQLKLADYQDGGSDGQGNFYTVDGNANYYITPNSIGNFYAIPGQSVVGGADTAGYARTIAVIPGTSCASPSNLIAGNTTTTTADIYWNAVSGATGYEYVIDNNPVNPGSSIIPIISSSFQAIGLLPGTQYYIHVRTNCGAGNYSAWSTAAFTTAAIAPCLAPGTPTITGITTGGAIINWAAVSGAIGYEYYLSNSSTPPTSGIFTTLIAKDTSGLDIGSQYYFHIRTKCTSNNFSGWVTAPFSTICPVATTVTISGLIPTGATISWTEVPGAEGYEFLVTTNPNPPVSGINTIFTTNPAGTLIPGTQYYAHVRVNCSPGIYSNWTTTTFMTPYPPCNAPVVTVNNTGSTFDANWTAVTGATGYEYAITTSSTNPASGQFTTETAANMTGLSTNTQYYFHIRTVCGPGRFSVWVKQPFHTSCFKPSLFIITNTTETGTADLGWNSVKGAVSYEYAILSNAASPGGSLSTTADTVLHATGLMAGSKYYLHVRTHCGPSSVSEWSVLEFYTSGIAIFPNPFDGAISVTIYGADTQNQELALFDAVGRLLKKIKLTTSTTTINMSGYAAGMYFIRFGKNKDYVKRVMKF